MAGVTIPFVDFDRFLGVTFDRLMTWSPHVRLLKEKLGFFAQVLRMLSSSAGGCSVGPLLHVSTPHSARDCSDTVSQYSAPFPRSTQRFWKVCRPWPGGFVLAFRRQLLHWGLSESLGVSHPVYLSEELLRAHLRLATRAPGHKLSSSSALEVQDILPPLCQKCPAPLRIPP